MAARPAASLAEGVLALAGGTLVEDSLGAGHVVVHRRARLDPEADGVA
jgi:hypothetical protein